MSELKEIGGFIVSADSFVNHDNSLSGNGTEVSPLGVVPGYNETVLWEGSANAGLFPITLSEPATAFEEIKFVWTPRYQGDYGCPTVVEVQNTNPHDGTLRYTLMHAYWNANTPWLGAWYLTPTDNYTKIASDKNAFCNMMSSQTAMSEGLNCFMWKVVGINRKV